MRNWRHTWKLVLGRLCRHTCYFCKSFFLLFEWLLIYYMELGIWSKLFLYSSVQFELFMLWMLYRCFLCFISCMNVNIKYLLIFGKCFQRPIFWYMCYRYELLVYYLQLYICLSLSLVLFYTCHSFLQRLFVFYICITEVFRLCLFLCQPYLLICICHPNKTYKNIFLLEVPEHC